MKTIALMVVLVGCSTDAEDDYPVRPGSAPLPPTASSPGMISGRVCVVDDPRDFTNCSPTDASGLSVTLGDSVATTTTDGSFSIAAQPDALSGDLMFRVSGPGLMTTQTVRSTADLLPVLRAELFTQMMRANGITLDGGAGSILGRVSRAGGPARGFTVSSTPASAFPVRFDGTTPTTWPLDATGARGVIWVPGVAAGPAVLTFRDLATSRETLVEGIPVINGGITMVDTVLP